MRSRALGEKHKHPDTEKARLDELISTECCTFKPLNLHLLIPYHCYLFDFVLFLCFQVFNKDARKTINFGFKAQFERT